jgi:hypothetical protein
MLRTMIGLVKAALLAGGLTALALHPAAADDGHDHDHGHAHGAPETLGKVHFPVTCTDAAQRDFDRAMALQHSFWYQASKQAFDQVLTDDRGCVMAYWGIAMSSLYNPFSIPLSKGMTDGAAALAKAAEIGAKSPREADYVAALGVLYKDFATAERRTRVTAYAAAMGALAARYPDDREAAIFYALALDVAAPPTDKTYANQLKAAAILETAFAEQPDHPGVAHYLIHTYDAPPLAAKGLPAALRYAEIAPSAPHAQHMPSHIFTRVGYWPQSIAANRRSADAAHEAGETADEMHADDYMVYAYLQTAQDAAARHVLEGIGAVMTHADPGQYAGFFAAASIPARYVLERGAWADAAALEPHPSKFPNVDAITHFARGLGAARSGNTTAARAERDRLRPLVAGLKDAKDDYWAEQTAIQIDILEAWIAHAEGRPEAVDLLRAAAEREDRTEKSPVTPGPLAPAREMLGEMLLEAGQPAAALAAFEASQRTEPNRFRSLFGAAHAAALNGDRARAQQYYSRLLERCGSADTARPELRQAKEFLGRG